MPCTLGNGATTSLQYDDAGALTKMTHGGLTKAGAAMSLVYSYEYDKAGNRTKITLDDTSASGTMDSVSAYDYDAIGRLTREARTGTPGAAGDYTTTYAFDSVGNRTAMTKVGPGAVTKVSTYAYNAGEQLTALTRTSNGSTEAVQTYAYDAAGQLTRMDRTAGGNLIKTYSWDHAGRITRAIVDDGTVKIVHYAYNPAGKRYMRIENGVTKSFSYQGENLASVSSSDNANLHKVYSVLGGNEGSGGGCGSVGGAGGIANVDTRHDVNTSNNSTALCYYLYNHRGNIVGVLDDSASLSYAYEYGAYGDVTQDYNSAGGPAPTNDILVTGKDFDATTGLYYFNARWYDPGNGQYISLSPHKPYMENRYAYCQSDPINGVDPTGLIGEWDGNNCCGNNKDCFGRPNDPRSNGTKIDNCCEKHDKCFNDHKVNTWFPFSPWKTICNAKLCLCASQSGSDHHSKQPCKDEANAFKLMALFCTGVPTII